MDVNYIGLRIEMIIPYMFQQHGASDHLARVFHQKLQQSELAGLQHNFNVTAKGAARQQVDFQIGYPIPCFSGIGTGAAM